MHVFVLHAVCQQIFKIIQVSKQDKYLHNSSGYSKFKRSTEERKKKYFIYKTAKIGSQYWGSKILTNLTPFPPPDIRFRCACVLKHLMVLNISRDTGNRYPERQYTLVRIPKMHFTASGVFWRTLNRIISFNLCFYKHYEFGKYSEKKNSQK